MNTQLQCIVVGGGLVGAAAALGLCRQGYGVTLLDPGVPEVTRGKLGVDIRNVALNPQSQTLLDEIAVWDGLDALAYNAMQVWEESGTGQLRFCAADVGRHELGWLLEMSPLQVALYQACQRELKVVTDALAEIQLSADRVTIVTAAGNHLAADFVVAADGAQSPVRHALNISRQSYPVDQHALATVVCTEQPHGGIAWQRFLRGGPLALLPSAALQKSQQDNLVSVVWSQPEADATRRQALAADEFCAELTRASEGVLGRVLDVDQRFCFPLHQHVARTFVHHGRVVLVGDAARLVHPLAGLGVNLGFEDVRALLKVTAAGAGLHTRRASAFNRQRLTRSQHMVSLLSLLKNTYAERNPWLLWLRNKAVHQLDDMSLVKQQIMREAMGLGPIADAG